MVNNVGNRLFRSIDIFFMLFFNRYFFILDFFRDFSNCFGLEYGFEVDLYLLSCLDKNDFLLFNLNLIYEKGIESFLMVLFWNIL